MKVGFLLPSSMVISGYSSGVNRQVLSYIHCLETIGIPAKTISIETGIYSFTHIVVIQHSLDSFHSISRIRSKKPSLKIIYAPIYDSSSISTNLLKSLLYNAKTELLRHPSSPRLMRLACDSSDVVLVRSDWEYTSIKKTGTKTPIRKVPLCLTDEHNINLANTRKDIDFLFVGLFSDPRKNVHRITRAAAQLHKDFHICGYGSNDFKVEMQQIFSSSKSDASIVFHGFVTDKELSLLFARAKVFCLPSLYEGVGLAALQAYGYGANVLISSKGGSAEYFGEDSFIIHNPRSISSIMLNMHKALLSSSSTCFIRSDFIDKYSPSSIAKQLESALDI